MKTSPTTGRAASSGAATILVLLLIAVPWAGAHADEVEVRTANIGLADGYWRLNARIDYQLTEEMAKALDSGVGLTFRVELVIDRVRGWLPDAEVLSMTRDWQISYEPLSKRYLVGYPDNREPTSHATLFGALNAAGRLQGVPVLEESRLDRRNTYDVALRALLDQQTLPTPLQMLAFWNRGFSLESDWYEWTLVP
jgi:hypothetical protein